MADQVKDSLGRIIQADVATIKELLQGAKVGPPVLHNQANNTEKLVAIAEEMKKILEKIDHNFSKNANDAEKLLKELASQSKKQVAASKSDDCCEKLLAAIKDMGKTEAGLLLEISKGQDKITKANKALGGGGSGGGGKGGNGGIGGNKIADAFDDAKYKKKLANILNYFEVAGAKITGGYSAISILMDGVVDKNLEFSMELKRVAWRVQGVTGGMKDVQSLWVDAADNWGEFQKLTGQSATIMQQSFLKLSKKGLLKTQGDIAKVNKLMVVSASTATKLGANVEGTTELFGDWAQYLGMSGTQLMGVSRHMSAIQRETGLAGDDLVQIAKASETMLKNLRNYGNLTTEAAQNVLSLMTNAKQLDLTDEMSELLKPLQSFSDFLAADGPYKQGLIMFAGRMPGLTDKILNGTFMRDKKNFSDLAKGQTDLVNSILSEYGASLDNFDHLSPEIRSKLDEVLKNVTGMTLNQNQRMNKALVDSSKTFADKLGEIEKEKKKLVDSVTGGKDEASLKLLESLEKQEKDLRIATAGAGIGAVLESVESGGTGINESSLKSMNELGIGGASDQEKMRNLFIKQAENLREASGGEVDLVSQMATADFSNSEIIKQQAGALETALAEQQKKEAKGTDPITEATDQLQKLNAFLAQHLSPWLSGISGWMVWVALIATTLPSVAGFLLLVGKGLFGFTKMLAGLGGIFSSAIGKIKGWFGRGPGGGPRPIGGGGGPVVTPGMGVPGTGPGRNRATLGRGASREERLARINEIRSKGVMTGGRTRMPRPALPTPKPTFGSKVKSFGSKAKGKLGGLLNLFGTGASMLGTAQAAGGGSGGNMGDCQPVWVCNMDSISGPLDQMSNGLAENALNGLMLTDAASDLKDAGKTLSGAGKAKSGGIISKFLGKESRFGKYVTQPLSKLGGAIKSGGGKLLGGLGGMTSKAGGMLGGAGRAAGGLLGKVAPFLGPLIGGITGAMEEDDGSGRGGVEKTILGALTGSSHKGSMMSGMLGIEAGGAGDEAMGVLGAAGGGALTGAAIGAFGGPIGAAIGGAIGGVIGGGAEIYKIITSPDSPLMAKVSEFGSSLWEGMKGIGSTLSDWGSTALDWASTAFDYTPIGAAFNLGKEAISFVGENWEGFTTGISNFATSAMDKASEIGGVIADTAGSLVDGALEIGGSMVDGAVGAISDVGDFLGGLFSWNKGTEEVTQGGLAHIHKGEMVVPSKEAELIRNMERAEGGTFGGVLGNLEEKTGLSALGDSIGNMFGISNLSDSLGKAFDFIASPITAMAKPITDVYDRVREQNASKTASISRSAELERIDEVSEKQLERLISIDENIKELVALMGPSQLVGNIASNYKESVGQRHNFNTPDYGEWPASLTPLGMGNKQVQSDGVVT